MDGIMDDDRRQARHALLLLPARRASVGSARHFAEALLRQWRLPEDDRDTAALVVGELAANAAEHGRPHMALRLTLGPDFLHIGVRDHGIDPGPRPPRPDGDPDEHGRGLGIVGALAARMDVRRDSAGWSVLVDLRLGAQDGPWPPAVEAPGPVGPATRKRPDTGVSGRSLGWGPGPAVTAP
ncbi:ATP-binding protein [Streptomyces sp. NPDC026672]|uniref:ATP-binding protein n=1 Tax=unclassified Streptomyces TaxID=2593676 RepID=UPI0034102F9B